MKWRYQPVWFDEPDGSKAFALIEVYFDDSGKLDGWTQDPRIPYGDDVADLGAELVRMAVDVRCWRPVAYKDLKPGYEFEQLVPSEDRKKLANFIDATAGDLEKYSSPTRN